MRSRMVCLGLVASRWLAAAAEPGAGQTAIPTNPWNAAVAEKATAIYRRLGTLQIHYAGLDEAGAKRTVRADAAYERLVREKLEGRWFAATVNRGGENPFAIQQRFPTWRDLVEFLAQRDALVEVWAPTASGSGPARRIPATDLAGMKRQRYERPTEITVTYPDSATGRAATFGLEFGFESAEAVWAAHRAYQRHRSLLLRAGEILGATGPQGLPDAQEQWERLQADLREGSFPIREMPPQPKDTKDLFLAVEFETDEQNNVVRPLRLYRDSEIRKQIVGDVQVLFLRKAGEASAHEVLGFRRTGFELQPMPNPILGEDVVELRVKDPTQPDPNRWHRLEFGEPALLKQSALAHFALLNAYLERRRKARLMTQANLALVTEPMIAALNVGGGLAGFGFPAGESARLLYNLVTWRLISEVPTAKQMRELFALMAARQRHTDLKLKPERFLSRGDIEALRKEGARLSNREVQVYLEQMSDEDIRAMLRLARLGMIDARVTTFLNLLTSAFKVQGIAEESGPIRELFNNVRFSLNGDINLKSLLLIAVGQKLATPLSGVSLETLSRGQGPQEAWLQYLEVSVDIRAVINTVARLTRRTFARKELQKPFPYAPRLNELAAYEVRIFGFPLLMFYKRGLAKADLAAYEHDYAYGLRGIRVVEHFPTRADMEAEIRAGRMFPLGLVRVPSVKGGWKETDLAVYAHRVARGRYRGKTTLIIYGLKAYQENSDLMAREILRFHEYERGLHEGAVIEQRLWTPAAASVPAIAFEPVIHVGPATIQSRYDPLLGNLLELRRDRLRLRWGLPVDPAEVGSITGRLAALGVQVASGDPLERLDPDNSSFVYRGEKDGHVELVSVTCIPSPADLDRDLQKAEDARLIEGLRRDAAANRSAGVVLLNDVLRVGDHFEPGPLLRDPAGRLVGAGVASGATAMEQVFRLINRLPVADRVRLQANHFAATLVQLEGTTTNPVFLTIEFPLGRVTNEWTNPLTGEREAVVYESGLWRQTITDRRIVELDYDAGKVETGSRTYLNRGDRRSPVRGALIDATRTLAYWRRDLSQPGLDPYQPVIAKLGINYVTGQITRDTYGLFTLPVEVADDQFVTRNRYTAHGLFESADVFDNGKDDAQFQRPPPTRVLEPIVGRPRFHLQSRLADNAVLQDLSRAAYRTVVERTDLTRNLTDTETIDNAWFGVKVREDRSDPFDGTKTFSSTVTWEYRPDFQAGLIPVRAITRASPSGQPLAEMTTTRYDPLRRQLVGVATSDTGRRQTNTWDYRWTQPVRIETAQRRDLQEFNREETVVRSLTVAADTDEVLSQSAGRFDPRHRTWEVTRQPWDRPQVPAPIEHTTYSALGKLINLRRGGVLEIRPDYSPDGTEQSRHTFLTNAASGRFDILSRLEDDYHWQDGARDARVRLYVDAKACDESRERTDAEGRIVEEGIRQWPQVALRTVRTYDGASDRVLKSIVLQNGEVRATHETLGLAGRPEGGWGLKVRVTPAWGLVVTNTYLLSDPLGRWVVADAENGDRIRVTAWFGGTAIARTSEVTDRQGRLKERFRKRVNAGTVEGVPYDSVSRFQVSPWGQTALVEEQGMIQGTDVLLFSDRLEERVHFDLAQPYPSPRYASDPRGQSGLPISFQGTVRSNITAVFTSVIAPVVGSAAAGGATEKTLAVSFVDLRGFFSYLCGKRVFDRAGNLLEQSTGKMRSLGARLPSEQTLRSDLAQAVYFERTTYRYQAGWMQPTLDQATGQPAVNFTLQPATKAAAWRVNETGWRDWATAANSYRTSPATFPGRNPTWYVSRRRHAPRVLRANSHLPGVTNVWVAWSDLELGPSGATLFESELIFDAQGEVSTRIDHKRDSRGRPATKIVYQLPTPASEAWQALRPQLTASGAAYRLSGPGDFSAADFVGFITEHGFPSGIDVELSDASGHSVVVGERTPSGRGRAVSFWPVERAQVQWMPDEDLPRRGAAVAAPRAQLEEGRLWVVSVPELAKAGLAVDRLASVDLLLPRPGPEVIRATPLYRLQSGEPPLGYEAGLSYAYDSQSHLGLIESDRRRKVGSAVESDRPSRGWQTRLAYGGLEIGSLAPHPQPPYFPVLILTDNADPEAPEPLYALAADDGRFLEYYQTVRADANQVYTVVNGFETPKLEVFRTGVLDDEIAAGILAFGQSYYVTLPLAKARGGLANAWAKLHNRCVASAFALAVDTLFGPLSDLGRRVANPKQRVWQQTPAPEQARAIEQEPTLAEAILAARPIPWSQPVGSGPGPPVGSTATNAAARTLLRLSRASVLVPTSPNTEVQRYVDTVQEAAIIELAIRLGEVRLAEGLLTFYSDRSHGGSNLLHASYDALTGASLGKQARFKRASEAPVTADAQLAIAQAACCLGTATGDPNAWKFGRNLIRGVLDDFRRPTNAAIWPRGIAERPIQLSLQRHGLRLWSAPDAFSVGSNARAFLLFRRLRQQADPLAPEWRQTLFEAEQETAAWLTNRIAPYVVDRGVVPKGLFEIQDVHNDTTALALERWTTTDDWLSFIEAADALGIRRDLTRNWLGNLARAHGVLVDGAWGLDWTVSLRRPDAISTGLTARFRRVADLLGDREAANFAERNLWRLRRGERWPVLVTRATANLPLETGQGNSIYPAWQTFPARAGESPREWPETLGVYAEARSNAPWPTNLAGGSGLPLHAGVAPDLTQFFWTAAGFYFALIVVALGWWALSGARRRRRARALAAAPSGLLVSDAVMRRAEERWAKRVLGLAAAPEAERTRYSNGAIEQNFHMQLRAIYKLVLEWRRLVHGWDEGDPRLVDEGGDEWLNGLDEFAVLVGIYTRWVIKAGRKDGLARSDVLAENEDSNHLWSRWVIYFSESHPRLLRLVKDLKSDPAAARVFGTHDQIELVLRTLGVRARQAPFDARAAFNTPAQTAAFDLLQLQLPGACLPALVEELERKLDIPREHVVNVIKGYKAFKEREDLYPVHPYVLEAAKVLPHFLLLGLVGLIWYNTDQGGLTIFPYLKDSLVAMALDWRYSLAWGLPLFAGVALSVTAAALRVYRYRWGTGTAAGPALTLDAEVSALFGGGAEAATPALKTGRWWNPLVYRRAGWVLRAVGLGMLAVALFELEPPTFATFMLAKAMLGMLLLMESASLLVPIVISPVSRWLEDHVSANPDCPRLLRFVNQLNIVPIRPASLIWLSLKYHFQPSVPTGGAVAMLQAVGSYLALAGVFFLVGSYMFKQALEIWFQEAYQRGSNLGLVVGTLIFWNTMYLLRFGLFVLLAALGSAAAIYPFRIFWGATALVCLGLQFANDAIIGYVSRHLEFTLVIALVALLTMTFEAELVAWLGNRGWCRRRQTRRRERQQAVLQELRRDPSRALGVVYMSGDDLSGRKLTPELLMTRVQLLRDRLGSGGMRLLSRTQSLPDDAALAASFQELYELEQRHDTTLWHPVQLVTAGAEPVLRPELGLNLAVADAGQWQRLLASWHLRRWLATMMSTAGHSQDTAVNLADFALALAREGLGANTVFYLIQNKYDNSGANRPSQLSYEQGELGQRNKLARLLMELAPGSRAYSVNDWTPFGFKAGGLVGMDLVYEESLKLTNMLVLDRNANAHDLPAVMADLKRALCDPGVVIVIPGRGTTNTLTPIGQGSQLIEEGQRALTRGIMMLGGTGAETLGTGWGNIQAVYYGRVQRALCDATTSRKPLGTASERGASFGERCEGLIGFGPHAIGISEDIWGVTQAAHNALGLGYPVRFLRSQALWHKIRESWSHAEWLSAFPRWSGGYLQMMLDPLMQQINDHGPMSVFAKEIRAGGGRFFLGAPFALLSILLMPLAIIADVSPFVQILILLWNLGLVMNQVLTALGLVAGLECTGFNRVSALAGPLGVALLAGWSPGWTPFALPLAVLGFLAGGFAMGLGRWLYYRGRDMMLFGPQLVIHALGQAVRQSLEFVLSGASANDAKEVNIAFRTWVGPREDRPFEGYVNAVNLRTVVWGLGLLALVLDLFALAHLDFLNVLLLLPSLMFSVSTLVGPFQAHPKPGACLGASVCVPRLLGWLASAGFYMLAARLIALGGWFERIGVCLCLLCLARVMRSALKYVGYARRLRRLAADLARELAEGGLPESEAQKLARHIVRNLGGDAGKVQTALQQTPLTEASRARVARLVAERLVTLLKRPVTDLASSGSIHPRVVTEFNRSFALGLFTFVWFFVVPVPGLLVFTAPGGYRISISPGGILALAAVLIGGVLAAGCISLLLEWWEKHGPWNNGLVARIEEQYRAFRSLVAGGALSAAEMSELYAQFTDVQTYFDQRSYAYVRRSLDRITQTLNAISSRAPGVGPAWAPNR